MHLSPSSVLDRRRRSPVGRRVSQRGATLLFALLALVVMLLGALALVRSVDVGAVLLGNIGLKQDATVTADQATKAAITWLGTQVVTPGALDADSASNGYYASTKEFSSAGAAQPPLDATGQQLASNRQLIDWDGNSCSAYSSSTYQHPCTLTPATVTGTTNTAQYIVFRLCSQPGSMSAVGYTGTCAVPPNGGTKAASRSDENYTNGPPFDSSPTPYYRVVVRVQGARNTTSFTETIVHF